MHYAMHYIFFYSSLPSRTALALAECALRSPRVKLEMQVTAAASAKAHVLLLCAGRLK